jgi:hypothetical protein
MTVGSRESPQSVSAASPASPSPAAAGKAGSRGQDAEPNLRRDASTGAGQDEATAATI